MFFKCQDRTWSFLTSGGWKNTKQSNVWKISNRIISRQNFIFFRTIRSTRVTFSSFITKNYKTAEHYTNVWILYHKTGILDIKGLLVKADYPSNRFKSGKIHDFRDIYFGQCRFGSHCTWRPFTVIFDLKNLYLCWFIEFLKKKTQLHHSANLGWWEPSYPSAVTGRIICIRSIHNRKYTTLHTSVRFFFKILLELFWRTIR